MGWTGSRGGVGTGYRDTDPVLDAIVGRLGFCGPGSCPPGDFAYAGDTGVNTPEVGDHLGSLGETLIVLSNIVKLY